MTCRDCSAPITSQSRTGRCKPCAIRHTNATDSGIKARRAEAWRRRLQDPEIKRQRREIGRRNALKAVAWCPPAYREEYQRLRRDKRLGAIEAKRIILEQVEADTRGLDPLAAAIKTAGLVA